MKLIETIIMVASLSSIIMGAVACNKIEQAVSGLMQVKANTIECSTDSECEALNPGVEFNVNGGAK